MVKAIARAVYSRKPVAIFDDVFSGLDKVTEQAVFSQIFGKDGLLRKNGTSVILATHAGEISNCWVLGCQLTCDSVHRLPESDHIVALASGGRVIEQGTFTDLKSTDGYVQSLDISGHDGEDEEDESLPETETAVEATTPKSKVDDNPEVKVFSDRSILNYYFQAIKPHNLAIQMFYIVAQAFLNIFRCKTPQSPRLILTDALPTDVWLTWWGDGKGHSSRDIGYWLSVYSVLSVLEGLFVTLAIA